MGEIYCAGDLNLNRNVAIKILFRATIPSATDAVFSYSNSEGGQPLRRPMVVIQNCAARLGK